MNHAFCFHLRISGNRNIFLYIQIIQDIISRPLYKTPLYILWYETCKLPSLKATDLLSCIMLYATLTGSVLLIVDKEKATVNLLLEFMF